MRSPHSEQLLDAGRGPACPGAASRGSEHPHAVRRLSPPAVRLGRRHELWVYGIVGALGTTGILWLVLHSLFGMETDLGPARHPLESWSLRVHGAAAMAFLVLVGTLLPVHVQRAWHLRRNVVSGLVVGVVNTLLVATGYALYYVGIEAARPWISLAHWAIGLALVPFVVVHVAFGKRRRRGRDVTRAHAGTSQPAAGPPEFAGR